MDSFQIEPSINERYKEDELHIIAEQGVTSFVNIFIGALQFDVPQLVSRELSWLGPFLEARNVQGNRVKIFLQLIKNRIESDFSPEEAKPLLEFIEVITINIKTSER